MVTILEAPLTPPSHSPGPLQVDDITVSSSL
jgi:hypothetical protein